LQQNKLAYCQIRDKATSEETIKILFTLTGVAVKTPVTATGSSHAFYLPFHHNKHCDYQWKQAFLLMS